MLSLSAMIVKIEMEVQKTWNIIHFSQNILAWLIISFKT